MENKTRDLSLGVLTLYIDPVVFHVTLGSFSALVIHDNVPTVIFVEQSINAHGPHV